MTKTWSRARAKTEAEKNAKAMTWTRTRARARFISTFMILGRTEQELHEGFWEPWALVSVDILRICSDRKVDELSQKVPLVSCSQAFKCCLNGLQQAK